MDVVKYIKDNYETTKEVYNWSSFILPSGEFVIPENYDYEEDLGEHANIINGVADNCFNGNWTAAEDWLSEYCVKCNVTYPYIAYPKVPTNKQYWAVEDLMDTLTKFYTGEVSNEYPETKEMKYPIQIILYSGNSKIYDLAVNGPEDITKRVQRGRAVGMLEAMENKLKYNVVAYNKDRGIYTTLYSEEEIQDAIIKAERDAYLCLKDKLKDDSGKPYNWIEVQDENGNAIWTSYEDYIPEVGAILTKERFNELVKDKDKTAHIYTPSHNFIYYPEKGIVITDRANPKKSTTIDIKDINKGYDHVKEIDSEKVLTEAFLQEGHDADSVVRDFYTTTWDGENVDSEVIWRKRIDYKGSRENMGKHYLTKDDYAKIKSTLQFRVNGKLVESVCSLKEGAKKDYNKLFSEFLDLIEFELVRNDNGTFSVIDLQGGNVGDIESREYENALSLIEDLDIYVDDYIFDSIIDELKDHGIESSYSDYRILRYRDKLPDSEWDFDVLDMIANHPNEIDLNKIAGESLEEKFGYVETYKGCKIHEDSSSYTATAEDGLTIGSSRTLSGAEALIDEYLDGKYDRVGNAHLSRKEESLKQPVEEHVAVNRFENKLTDENSKGIVKLKADKKGKVLKEGKDLIRHRVLHKGDEGFDNLQLAAEIATEKSPKGFRYTLGDTYLDFGSGMQWTTLIANRGRETYQALDPNEWEKIVNAKDRETIERVIDGMFADKYCPDRIDKGSYSLKDTMARLNRMD